MIPIIVLRPEPGASETVRRAQHMGLEAIPMPLFAVEPVAWATPESSRFDGLLLTSANALRHGGPALMALRALPVHAVGAATAAAAREAGFDIASEGEAGVDRLLGSIDPQLRLLHPCGADRYPPADARQRITAIPVYRALPIGGADVSVAAGGIALVHSPRAGARFAALIDQAQVSRSSVSIAAISAAAGQAAGDHWGSVAHAPQPTDAALLALVERLCQKRAGE